MHHLTSTHRHPTGRAGSHELSRRLRTEWAAIRRCPDATARARAWEVTPVPFADLDELLGLAGHETDPDPACEAVLAGLVERSADDPLAGRVVVQRMLPGLLARSRRHRERGIDEAFEELVSAAWITIHEYAPARRPSCLVAALLSGTEYRAFGRADRERRRRRRTCSLEPRSFEEAVVVDGTRRLDQAVPIGRTAPLPVVASEELARLLDDARDAGLTDDDLAIER